MSNLFQVAVSLGGAILAIVLLGVRMTRVADRIATSTGLSRGFVGMLLLAASTSLPELVSSLAAVLVMNAPGLAFGNVFGSNVANLSFLGVMDALVAGSIFATSSRQDAHNTMFGIVLTALSLTAIILSNRTLDAELYGDLYRYVISFAILAIYLIALRASYSAPSEDEPPAVREPAPWAAFVACAAAVVGVSFWLTWSCAELARLSGVGETFVGALVLALATSLPELVVSVEAVRLGSPAMAIGNLVGSNMFNLSILASCALCLPRENLFALPEASAALPAALTGIAMMALVAIACWTRSSTALGGRISPVSVVLAVAYVAANAMMYGR